MQEEEKPYPPTKRKLKKEKEKGNAPVSKEWASALFLTLCLLALFALLSLSQFETLFQKSFTRLNSFSIDTAFYEIFEGIWLPLLLFFLFVWALAIFVYVSQRGWIWSWKKRKGLFGNRSSSRKFFPWIKLLALLYCATLFLLSLEPEISFSRKSVPLLIKKAFFGVAILLLVSLVFGLIDLFYQRWSFYKKMRMTRKEMEDEKREEETNKGNRKR